MDQDFLKKLDQLIEENLANEKFSVPDLARKMGMSRSTLHRKVVEATKLSVSQYIRQIRLRHAMRLLREKSLSVSEIAYKVGFNSPIYFSKCFHEFYGFPPNRVGKREVEGEAVHTVQPKKKSIKWLAAGTVLIVFLAIVLFFVIREQQLLWKKKYDKSVIVLYPSYNSVDSVYLSQINGTMDAIVNNLSLVNDLTVFPWSTSYKFKDSGKSAVEIAREIKANYVVESSGLVIGDRLRLNVKLIDAIEGIQIWYSPYDVDISAIIQLPLDISGKIAREIQAEITPAEKERMDTKPTQNSDAWNYYLKGRELYLTGLREYYGTGDAGNAGNNEYKGLDSFISAIEYFKKAVEYDKTFALPYAQMAMIYYLMDMGTHHGKYSDEITLNADLAVLNDSKSDICLLAKAFDYENRGENQKAIPYLEKALEYNPKSVETYRFLANIYNMGRLASTEKYLEYKLQVVRLAHLIEDSIQRSEDYRLAARALRVAGFYHEALNYIEMALELNPLNFSAYGEKSEIIIESERNYPKAIEVLFEARKKDSTNLEILRYLFTDHYLNRDFSGALKYFNLFAEVNRELTFLATRDNSRLSVMYKYLNMPEKAEYFAQKYNGIDWMEMTEYNRSSELARVYALQDKKREALEQLKILRNQDFHFSYTIRMLEDDPVYDNIRNTTEFQLDIKEMKEKFAKNNQNIQMALRKKKLL